MGELKKITIDGEEYIITPVNRYKSSDSDIKAGELKEEIPEISEQLFKIGDYVKPTSKNKWFSDRTGIVKSITENNSYIIADFNDNKFCFTKDEMQEFRLWDAVKDAKYGDVLRNDGDLLIFENANDSYKFTVINCLYVLYDNGEHETKVSVTYNNCRPATYQEIELLNKDIEKSGFKWDKKEGKLISLDKLPFMEDNGKTVSGYWITCDGEYRKVESVDKKHYIFSEKKYAKSAKAFALITQIMANDKRFGGVVTDDEWKDSNVDKFVIYKVKNKVYGIYCENNEYHLLAFHTREQLMLFMEENLKIVMDYLMID